MDYEVGDRGEETFLRLYERLPERGLALCAQEQAEQTGSQDEGILKERGDAVRFSGADMGQARLDLTR